MERVLSLVSDFVWGPPVLVLLMGTGLYLTIRLKGLQLTQLPFALKQAFSPHQDHESAGDISHFQALMTALAAPGSNSTATTDNCPSGFLCTRWATMAKLLKLTRSSLG